MPGPPPRPPADRPSRDRAAGRPPLERALRLLKLVLSICALAVSIWQGLGIV
ncbi:MAG: hypothetical protein ABEJ42_10315 [Halobacteriaceae archaeon]